MFSHFKILSGPSDCWFSALRCERLNYTLNCFPMAFIYDHKTTVRILVHPESNAAHRNRKEETLTLELENVGLTSHPGIP